MTVSYITRRAIGLRSADAAPPLITAPTGNGEGEEGERGHDEAALGGFETEKDFVDALSVVRLREARGGRRRWRQRMMKRDMTA